LIARNASVTRAICACARELDLNEGTRGSWVAPYRNEHGAEDEPELNISERARLRELERG
jgi:transposase